MFLDTDSRPNTSNPLYCYIQVCSLSEKKVQKLSLGMYLFKRYTLLYLKGAYWYILAPKMNISTLKLYILVPEMYILAPISI